MRFASQEFFDKLKESIMDENSDDSIYTELYEVLLHDTKYRIIRNVGFEDWEDVFQEVAWSVIRQLPRYLLNSEDKHEAQRQSWLEKVEEISGFDSEKKCATVKLKNGLVYWKGATENILEDVTHYMLQTLQLFRPVYSQFQPIQISKMLYPVYFLFYLSLLLLSPCSFIK